jgi:hypothetical protein
MKKIWLSFALFAISQSLYCWDMGGKLDAQRSSTSNVNLTETSPIKDTYSTLRGYLQAKNDTFRIKLRGRKEKYTLQNANDNYFADLSLQYKHSQEDDYTIGIFKQAYDGPTIVSTDTTSDNLGGRFSADFSKDFGNDNSGYLSIKGSQKKYSKIPGRTDKIVGGTLGIEHYFSSRFMVNTDLSLQKNKSTLSHYSNLSLIPNLLISFNPYDSWEIFADASYAKTNYSERTVIISGVSQNINETQSLVSFDIGTVYKLTKNVSLQMNYSSGKNSSNNPSSVYKADILSLGLILKF